MGSLARAANRSVRSRSTGASSCRGDLERSLEEEVGIGIVARGRRDGDAVRDRRGDPEPAEGNLVGVGLQQAANRARGVGKVEQERGLRGGDEDARPEQIGGNVVEVDDGRARA